MSKSRGKGAWPWALGSAVAVAVLGPALGPGSLLNLDLVLTPELPVPSGIWGLGPDLPRQVPFGVVLAWLSQVASGPVAGKLWLAASLAVACAGAARLARPAPIAARAGAGLLYALSPFLLTRVAVGHLGLVAALALLPWALPALLQPAARPRTTVLWAVALGVTGFGGGVLALALVAVGLVADRTRPALLAGLGSVVAQLPWIVPGLVVTAAGRPDPAGGAAFATQADGLLGFLAVGAGHGFWRSSSQIGGGGRGAAALLGVVLVALAAAGASRLPPAWGRRAVVAAGIGAGLALASALPGLDKVYADVTGTVLGAPARESQRWLALFVVWMAPAAALGAARLGGLTVALIPAGAALALAGPSLWGLDGRLQPVDLPEGWADMRAAVRVRPGPVLALPWHQYLDLRVADGRRVRNPLPDYLGGDVLVSSDPQLGAPRRERADPREPMADAIVDRIRGDHVSSARLARLGVRWVAVLHEVDFRDYDALGRDPGLERVVGDPAVDLYRVRAWRGPATADGRAVPVRAVVAPLVRIDGRSPVTWHRAGLPGWARGTQPGAQTRDGTLRLPPGDDFVWYRPSAFVAFADICTLLLAGALLTRARVATVRSDRRMQSSTDRST